MAGFDRLACGRHPLFRGGTNWVDDRIVFIAAGIRAAACNSVRTANFGSAVTPRPDPVGLPLRYKRWSGHGERSCTNYNWFYILNGHRLGALLVFRAYTGYSRAVVAIRRGRFRTLWNCVR